MKNFDNITIKADGPKHWRKIRQSEEENEYRSAGFDECG